MKTKKKSFQITTLEMLYLILKAAVHLISRGSKLTDTEINKNLAIILSIFSSWSVYAQTKYIIISLIFLLLLFQFTNILY